VQKRCVLRVSAILMNGTPWFTANMIPWNFIEKILDFLGNQPVTKGALRPPRLDHGFFLARRGAAPSGRSSAWLSSQMSDAPFLGVGPAARCALQDAATFELRRNAKDGEDDLGEVGCGIEERFGQ
jgi:hypothetical protein